MGPKPFDKGVSRELALVLVPGDNMAAYQCEAGNEAGAVMSAETRLQVLCRSSFTSSSPPPRSSSVVLERCDASIYLHLHSGLLAAALSKAIYNKYTWQKKEKQQYIAVGTVRMFIETSAKH